MTSSKKKKTMSDKAIAANQANAQKSTGPKTPEGKEAVKYNAMTYGLYCADPVVPGESLEEYREYHVQMFRNLDPSNAYQADLVDNVITQLWHLKRLAKKEANIELFTVFQEDNIDQLLKLELLRSRKLNNINKAMNALRTTRDRSMIAGDLQKLVAVAEILQAQHTEAPQPEALPTDPEAQEMTIEYLVEDAGHDAGRMLKNPKTMETSLFRRQIDNMLSLLDIHNPTPLDIIRHRLRRDPRRLEAEALEREAG